MIDWFRVYQRAIDKDNIAAAVSYITNMPGTQKDPTKVPTIWQRPKDMPTIRDIDFQNVTTPTVSIANLLSSNKRLDRQRLIWHAKHPGQRMHVNPLTALPLVGTYDDGQVIIDGHHYLAAQLILGTPKAQVYLLGATPAK